MREEVGEGAKVRRANGGDKRAGAVLRRRFLPFTRLMALLGGAFAILVLVLWIFHSEKTSIVLPAQLERGELKVSLRAYSAEKVAEQFYEAELVGKYSDGALTVEWEIPNEYRDRDTYIEVVAAEPLTEAESYNSSCAYFVPVYAKGFVPDVLDWNKMDERQRVGCIEQENSRYSSYIAALADVQEVLYQDIVMEGGTVLVPNTSGEGGLSVEEVENIVNQVIEDKVSVFVGPQGERGLDGRDGVDGADGEDGEDGVCPTCEGGGGTGPAGPKGDKGDTGATGPAGPQGEKGDTGAKGDKGDTGAAGANGTDGVVSVTDGLVLDNHVLSLETCAEGEILKVVNGLWDCAVDQNTGSGGTDNDTKYVAGNGLELTVVNGQNVFGIDALACAAGQYLTWNGTAFSCAVDQNTPDTDTDTQYGAKADGGLVLDSNNDFALMTCTDTQILKWNGTSGRWECAADQNTSQDLSGYLQIADLQSAINGLTPGYYTKTEVDNLLNTFANTIPAGGLKVPQEVATESSLSAASCTEEGDHFYVQNMDVTAPGHTGKAWCYDDNGTMKLYKVYDNYLSPDNTSIILNNGQLSVSTIWLDSQLQARDYATETFVNNAIAAIDYTPFVRKTDIPTCSAGYVLTSTTAGTLSCVQVSTVDNDTTYQAGDGLKLVTAGGNNVFSVDAAACAANQYLTWNGASFLCADLPSGGGAGLSSGTVAGEMLYWNGTDWVLSGNGGSQTLDFVTVNDDLGVGGELAVGGDALVSGSITPAGGIVDSYGRTGAYGEHLVIDINGNLKWEMEMSCATVIQPTDAPYTYFPIMTSDNSPAPFEIYTNSTQDVVGHRTFHAFDGNPATFYHTNYLNGLETSPAIVLQIGDSTISHEVTNYSIRNRASMASQAPRDWTFEGSNDNSSWTVLDTQSGITYANAGETKIFALLSAVRYNYYRLVITANNGYSSSSYGEVIAIAELKLTGVPNSPTTIPLLTVKAGDRYSVPGRTVADMVVEDTSGNSYAVGDEIPAGAEVVILTDGTKIGLLDDITTDTGWVRRAEFCGVTMLPGGANLPDGTRAGQALIWNGTDWVAGEAISIDYAGVEALNIADGAGNTAFNVDTVNGQVAIGGGGTVDQIPFALVLDSFGDGSGTDPNTLAIDGAMYYNSDMGKFRCYEGGVWKDCIGGGGGSSSVTVNYIPQDSNGNINVGAHDVGTYTDDEIDEAIDEELTFEYLDAPISIASVVTPASVAPVSYRNAGSVALGNQVYTFGGYTSTWIDRAYRYNASGVATQIAAYPQGATAGMAVATDGDDIFIFGGSSNATWSRTMAFRYDPSSDTYTSLAGLATVGTYGISDGSAVYHDGKIYIVGGLSGGTDVSTAYSRLVIYDVASDSYSEVANFLPVARSKVGLQLVGDTLYMIGGTAADGTSLSDVYAVDLSAGTLNLETLASMPNGRSAGSIYYRDGSIFHLGGVNYYGDDATASIYIYNTYNNTWRNYSGAAFSASAYAAYGQLGESLLIIGGSSTLADSLNVIRRAAFQTWPVAYLKVGERYNFAADTYCDVGAEDAGGNAIAAGSIIAAGTEVVALQDTRVYLNEDLTAGGSWVRRGGAGGPIQIGVVTPTIWTDDVVKKNGEVWLKMNGQEISAQKYPALASYISMTEQIVSPKMTSNTTPAPYVASASTVFSASYTAWKAFDQTAGPSGGDSWHSAVGSVPGNAWLQIDLGAPTRVGRYMIASRGIGNSGGTGWTSSAGTWELLGSNDGVSWTSVDSRAGEVYTSLYEKHYFNLASKVTYRFYRINVLDTSSPGGTYTNIGEFTLYDPVLALPNYGTNAAGQYYYIKADGFTNNGYTIADGSAGGQVLTWDDTVSQWVAGAPSGAGGVAYAFSSGLDLDVGTSTVSLAYIDDATGDFVFKNAMGDTTSAFRVTNAADAPMFTIDSVSGAVQIGSAVGDGTAVALILDSSTVAPSSPQNGMMYYDTTFAKFRCYEGGEWKDCIGGSVPMRENNIIAGTLAADGSVGNNTWKTSVPTITQGDAALLAGNEIVIPEDGYYTVSTSAGVTNVATSQKGQMISADSGVGIIANDMNNDNNTFVPGASGTLYLTAGTKVRFQYIFNSAASSFSTVPKFAIARFGNSNLAERPDLWVVGTEYDFGDGLYGQRFTGNVVGAADTQINVALATNTGITLLGEFGGVYRSGNSADQQSIGQFTDYDQGAFSTCYVSAAGDLMFRSRSQFARVGTSNNDYDVWVKYRK